MIMNAETKPSFWKQLVWPWNPSSNLEAGSAVVKNFLLHWFPNRVSKQSLAFSYSMYLGTITFTLFLILTVTGLILMFHYTPSVERAYWSMKDIEFAVSFGWFLRRLHRLAAHLMVATVFLHMFRVFYTSAYKDGAVVNSKRSWNWVMGVVLLVLTLLLSFTGYLLPWDQLAFWAITVGTNIAGSVPLIGEQLRESILGGTIIGQNALIRFYVLHVFVLPVVLFALAFWHMWRIRKDGGLAIIEQVRIDAREQGPKLPRKTKTFSVLGIARGTTAQVMDPTVLNENNSLPSTPNLTVRLLNIVLVTVLVTIVLSLFIAAPLEQPANPEVTPNPAKAPWYFLGLQELVGYSAFVGGVLIPLLVVVGLAVIPFMDRGQQNLGTWFTDQPGKRWAWIGLVWGFAFTTICIFIGIKFPMREIFPGIESQLFFEVVNPANLLLLSMIALYFISLRATSSQRTAAMATFSAFIVAFIFLTYTGTALRGPNWIFYWPWESWPTMPIPY
ncbi:MAG: cytochrome b N-terminal domain-containing protein [Bacteroidetes bacterium]|nr:cytochrome b N-terminal domain-containing protein [Bacteroidota bacterium]